MRSVKSASWWKHLVLCRSTLGPMLRWTKELFGVAHVCYSGPKMYRLTSHKGSFTLFFSSEPVLRCQTCIHLSDKDILILVSGEKGKKNQKKPTTIGTRAWRLWSSWLHSESPAGGMLGGCTFFCGISSKVIPLTWCESFAENLFRRLSSHCAFVSLRTAVWSTSLTC